MSEQKKFQMLCLLLAAEVSEYYSPSINEDDSSCPAYADSPVDPQTIIWRLSQLFSAVYSPTSTKRDVSFIVRFHFISGPLVLVQLVTVSLFLHDWCLQVIAILLTH